MVILSSKPIRPQTLKKAKKYYPRFLEKRDDNNQKVCEKVTAENQVKETLELKSSSKEVCITEDELFIKNSSKSGINHNAVSVETLPKSVTKVKPAAKSEKSVKNKNNAFNEKNKFKNVDKSQTKAKQADPKVLVTTDKDRGTIEKPATKHDLKLKGDVKHKSVPNAFLAKVDVSELKQIESLVNQESNQLKSTNSTDRSKYEILSKNKKRKGKKNRTKQTLSTEPFCFNANKPDPKQTGTNDTIKATPNASLAKVDVSELKQKESLVEDKETHYSVISSTGNFDKAKSENLPKNKKRKRRKNKKSKAGATEPSGSNAEQVDPKQAEPTDTVKAPAKAELGPVKASSGEELRKLKQHKGSMDQIESIRSELKRRIRLEEKKRKKKTNKNKKPELYKPRLVNQNENVQKTFSKEILNGYNHIYLEMFFRGILEKISKNLLPTKDDENPSNNNVIANSEVYVVDSSIPKNKAFLINSSPNVKDPDVRSTTSKNKSKSNDLVKNENNEMGAKSIIQSNYKLVKKIFSKYISDINFKVYKVHKEVSNITINLVRILCRVWWRAENQLKSLNSTSVNAAEILKEAQQVTKLLSNYCSIMLESYSSMSGFWRRRTVHFDIDLYNRMAINCLKSNETLRVAFKEPAFKKDFGVVTNANSIIIGEFMRFLCYLSSKNINTSTAVKRG